MVPSDVVKPARRRSVAIWLLAVFGGAVASCGSRTGLFGEDDGSGITSDGGVTRPDASVIRDASRRDVTDFDAIPPIDATPRPDVDRRDCPDADSTYVYLVTSDNQLLSFYPPDLSFQTIGTLACPTPTGSGPFSMAVDRRGIAYVVFTDGRLYRVSTATAACTTTPFVPGQQGFQTFGMGFASDMGGPAERLYVSDNESGGQLRGLGWIDTTTFALSFIGPINPPLARSELTGTGDGRLFAFSPTTGGSRLFELNKTTGQVTGQTLVPAGASNDAFAFAFWGGDFWFFTADASETTVTRYRPADGTTTPMTTYPAQIVGAGVSTCAPQE